MTKQNVASKEIPTIEFHIKCMESFINVLSIICELITTKFHNTPETFYFEVILVQDLVSCEVSNVTKRYMNFILDLDEELKTCMSCLKQEALLSIKKLLISCLHQEL